MLAAFLGLTKGLLCAITIETFENLLLQNSGCPLQGRVFEGRGLAEVVAVFLPLSDIVEGDNPTMAVISSVVVEVVAVAFCLEETLVAIGMPEGSLDIESEEDIVEADAKLLEPRNSDADDGTCAATSCMDSSTPRKCDTVTIRKFVNHKKTVKTRQCKNRSTG